MPLYTEFLSDLHEKFQVASVYGTNVEYQIWCFCCKLFLSYADNRHTDTNTRIHTDHLLKMWFSYSGDLKTCNSINIFISKIWPQNSTFFTITWVRGSNSLFLMHQFYQFPKIWIKERFLGFISKYFLIYCNDKLQFAFTGIRLQPAPLQRVKICQQQNRIWIAFVTCLQDRTKKYGYINDYFWKNVHSLLF